LHQNHRPDQQQQPTEALFYGLATERFEQLICKGFRLDKWHTVKAMAGLWDVEEGNVLQQYNQQATYPIVGGVMEVLGSTTEQAGTAS
jgi:hypothetical protein